MRRRDREQGAVAIMMALIICFVMIPLAAFAVDLGQQRVARRDAQALADQAALDTARALGSGTTSITDLRGVATTSVGRASGYVGRSAPTVQVYLGKLSSNFSSDQSYGCDGNPTDNGYFTPTNDHPDAVLVTVTNAVDFNLMHGSGGVCRSAIGSAYLQACMMMDSYAAALNTGDSAVLGPLNKALGTNIDATVLGSSGILTTDLDVLTFLNVLKAQLSVGSVDQVLSSNVNAAQVVAAEVAALSPPNGTASAVAQVLQAQIGTHINSATQFNVGTLLGITQGGSSGLGAKVNPLDLAAAAVQLANGTNAISLGLTGGNLIGLSATATVGSRPTRVCLGDGKKTEGQTSVAASAKLDKDGTLVGTVTSLVNGLSGLLGNTLCLVGGLLGGNCYSTPTLSDITLNANLSLAQASGTVTDVNCDDKTYIATLEQSKLAPATITLSFTVTMKHTFYKLLGSIDHVDTLTSTVTTTISTDTPADKSTADKLYVPDDYAKGKAGPSGDLSVTNLGVNTVVTGNSELISKLGGLVNSVNNLLITPILSTTMTPLLNTLTTSLKNLVGLTIAGSNYTPLPTPSCGTPKLSG